MTTCNLCCCRFLGFFARPKLDYNAARMLLINRRPRAAEVVANLAISRIEDEDRIPLFLAIADELESDTDLEVVYKGVEGLRNKTAHAAEIARGGPDRLVIKKFALIASWNKNVKPSNVERAHRMSPADWAVVVSFDPIDGFVTERAHRLLLVPCTDAGRCCTDAFSRRIGLRHAHLRGCRSGHTRRAGSGPRGNPVWPPYRDRISPALKRPTAAKIALELAF
jgi:hypothetical protein